MNKRITRLAGVLSIALIMGTATPAVAVESRVAPMPAEKVLSIDLAPRIAVSVATPTVRVSKEFRRAHSKNAADMSGYEPSMYHGIFYRPKQEKFRKCVMSRESNFHYRSANKASSARGAYQFLDRAWRDGLVHMMIKESKKTKDGLLPNLNRMFHKPIHQWSRYFQDRAWFTAMNYNGNWSGKKHWNATVPGTSC